MPNVTSETAPVVTRPLRDRRLLGWAALVAAVAAAVAFHRIGVNDVWHDEAASFHFARLPFTEIPGELARRDNHGPLYFLVLKAVTAALGAGENAVAARSLSALAAVGSAVGVTFLGARLFGRFAGVSAGLLLAVCPLHAVYAQEVRFYALAELLVVLHVLGLAALLLGTPGRWPWLLTAGAGAAAFLTFYLTVAVVGVGLLIAVLARRGTRRSVLTATCAAAACVLVWVPGLLTQSGHFVRYLSWIPERSVLDFLLDVGRESTIGPAPASPWAIASAAVLALTSAIGAIRSATSRQPSRYVVLGAAAAPIAAILVASLYRPFEVTRYALVGVPFLAVLAGAGIGWISDCGWRLTSAVVLVVAAAAPLGGVLHDHSAPRRTERWREAVAWLEPRVLRDDVVAVAPHWDLYSLEYHLPGRRLAGVRSPDDVATALAEGTPRVWLFVSFPEGVETMQSLDERVDVQARHRFGSLELRPCVLSTRPAERPR